MKTTRAALRAVPLWLAFCSTAAMACGYCVEDRIAAVYDHALVQRTQASKLQLIVFAWDGPLIRSEASRRKLMGLVGETPGIAKGSTRVSMEPAALAVAFDPTQTSLEKIQAALQKRLGVMKISIVPLQASQPH